MFHTWKWPKMHLLATNESLKMHQMFVAVKSEVRLERKWGESEKKCRAEEFLNKFMSSMWTSNMKRVSIFDVYGSHINLCLTYTQSISVSCKKIFTSFSYKPNVNIDNLITKILSYIFFILFER